MLFFFDLLPVLLFFLSFKFYGIYIATAVGIVATSLQVLLTVFFKQHLDKQQLITLAVFLVFGGMTLYFHNPIFIKWKPTIIFSLFAFVLLGSQWIGSKPLIQRLLESAFSKQDAVFTLTRIQWKRLNLAWTSFFFLLALINLYIAYSFSTEIWVNFKLYGIFGLLLAFSLLQSIYLSRYQANKG